MTVGAIWSSTSLRSRRQTRSIDVSAMTNSASSVRVVSVAANRRVSQSVRSIHPKALGDQCAPPLPPEPCLVSFERTSDRDPAIHLWILAPRLVVPSGGAQKARQVVRKYRSLGLGEPGDNVGGDNQPKTGSAKTATRQGGGGDPGVFHTSLKLVHDRNIPGDPAPWALHRHHGI